MRVTNNSNIGLPLAVWLLHDEYDYVNEPNYISVTGLMKPLRHIVIPPRLSNIEITAPDVSDYVARTLGHSIHDSIEKAWVKNPGHKLRKLGIPEEVIERLRVNPTDEELEERPDIIPVYLEQRGLRVFDGYTIGGKYDMVAEGIVQDNKSTSVFAWLAGTRDTEYQLQMSLYRWIDADRPQQGLKPRITEDFCRVNFIFTDWTKMQSRSNPNYPKRVEEKEIWLLSLDETEAFVRDKLAQIARYQNEPEHLLPECTPEELWMSQPRYKYFSDPSKANVPGARSTKNFDDPAEAHRFQAEKGKGVVITVPGEPKRCDFCPAFEGCTQKDRYFT